KVGLIRQQLLYTLATMRDTRRAAAQLGAITLLSSTVVPTGDAATLKLRYDIVVPVAWGDKVAPPTVYGALQAPRDIRDPSLAAYVERNLPCFKVPEDARNPEYRWYDFRPDLDVCHLASSDTVRFTAHVTRSTKNDVGATYPEYARIWEDGVF